MGTVDNTLQTNTHHITWRTQLPVSHQKIYRVQAMFRFLSGDYSGKFRVCMVLQLFSPDGRGGEYPFGCRKVLAISYCQRQVNIHSWSRTYCRKYHFLSCNPERCFLNIYWPQKVTCFIEASVMLQGMYAQICKIPVTRRHQLLFFFFGVGYIDFVILKVTKFIFYFCQTRRET